MKRYWGTGQMAAHAFNPLGGRGLEISEFKASLPVCTEFQDIQGYTELAWGISDINKQAQERFSLALVTPDVMLT